MASRWRRLVRALGLAVPNACIGRPGLDRRTIELLARVAHEVRQPLSAAVAAFQIIRKSSDGARRERACTVLDRQFVRLSRLFDDLLEMSRSRLGMTSLRLEKIDLRGVVEEVADAMRPQVAEKHQYLDLRIPVDPIWVDADFARLQQVVTNVLANGVRYTDPGGQLRVYLTPGPEEAVLTISDTGRGIPADLLPHVFEPFLKRDAASEHGLGVGLAIARHLVELHGGSIRASSAGRGNGSEFIVVLPTCVRTPPRTSRRVLETNQ